MTSVSIPAVERRGVLVTNLGATLIKVIVALYADSREFLSTKHPKCNTVLATLKSTATGSYG